MQLGPAACLLCGRRECPLPSAEPCATEGPKPAARAGPTDPPSRRLGQVLYVQQTRGPSEGPSWGSACRTAFHLPFSHQPRGPEVSLQPGEATLRDEVLGGGRGAEWEGPGAPSNPEALCKDSLPHTAYEHRLWPPRVWVQIPTRPVYDSGQVTSPSTPRVWSDPTPQEPCPEQVS